MNWLHRLHAWWIDYWQGVVTAPQGEEKPVEELLAFLDEPEWDEE